MKKIIYLLSISIIAILFVLQSNLAYSQHAKMQFSHQDSLRGALRKERAYDVKYYDLNLKIDIENQSISGYNKITFQNIDLDSVLQLDLFENFEIDSIIYHNQSSTQTLQNRREGNVIWVEFPAKIRNNIKISKENKTNEIISVFYHGKPQNAVNPPWDGGFTWEKIANEKPWITVSCQGLGASSWFPLKDHLSDEPDSVRMYFEVPKDLFCVSNGDLIFINKNTIDKNYVGYEWKTSYPISSYNMTLNIGDYVHFEDKFISKKSKNKEALKLDYYVIKGNEKEAKPYFEDQVKKMLEAFEWCFGNYPFEKDGYALVETPYWGMEHQSCVAYGNHYNLNSFGFDFIIIHESGHEFFGNSISANDNAELWIHESFTTYSEALFVEYFQGKEKAIDYLLTQKPKIMNKDVILAPLDVNYNNWLGSDMYYKGSWMLHSLRSVIADDDLWFATVKDFYQKNKHSHLNTKQVIEFFNQRTNKNLTSIFNFYLTNKEIPVLEYEILEEGNKLFVSYKWKNNEDKNTDFEMPVEVFLNGNNKGLILNATTAIQKLDISNKISKKDRKKIELEINKRKYLATILKK
ncbi:aminopeptidase N [Bernardetia litoralis DSM 6794]|uniref:Aminopeptidase N n=1 Tax=Bernardetia litoralis (strain ATCC 23117 / DSM 6794 / NBRC 15988 / NCIMB 1366 / Fx l1 / Sio-4) TaxID=880071 RepID=I4AGP7_BERLS|nr:M1 family metallopeptidase [Bernardetia litoralis]AFM03132.1 aminopeptidase N [Bernardetia litoralis DSM 6794]